MAWYNRKKPDAIKVPKRARPAAIVHRSSAALASWYNTNRAFLNSPNTEIKRNLEKLVDLSRLLCGMNPYASKYLELVAVNVGDIQLMPRVMNADGVLDIEVNNTIKAAFLEFSETASADGRFSMSELSQMLLRGMARDGEAVIQIVRGKAVNKFGFALQPIDPTLLDVRFNLAINDKQCVNMGIETLNGKPIAFHIWSRHMDDSTGVKRERMRIPAEDIIHVFDAIDPNQQRGVPWLASVLRTLGLLDEYQTAHLITCQAGAAVPLKLITKGDVPVPESYTDVGVATDAQGNAIESAPPPSIDLTYNQIIEVEQGKDLVPFDLKYPQTGFDMAVKTYLQQIAAGMMISYASLTSDGSSESFSTVRFSSQAEKDYWKQIQNLWGNRFYKRVYRAWLECAMLSGALKLKGDAEDYYAADFRPRGFMMADPRRDVDASVQALAEGLTTRTQLAAEAGGDFEENIRTLANEQAIARKYGVTLPGMTPNEQTTPNV